MLTGFKVSACLSFAPLLEEFHISAPLQALDVEWPWRVCTAGNTLHQTLTFTLLSENLDTPKSRISETHRKDPPKPGFPARTIRKPSYVLSVNIRPDYVDGVWIQARRSKCARVAWHPTESLNPKPCNPTNPTNPTNPINPLKPYEPYKPHELEKPYNPP